MGCSGDDGRKLGGEEVWVGEGMSDLDEGLDQVEELGCEGCDGGGEGGLGVWASEELLAEFATVTGAVEACVDDCN